MENDKTSTSSYQKEEKAMTPEDKQRAKEISDNATPGQWRFENLNWIGTPIFGVYTSPKQFERGQTLFDNIDPVSGSYYNVEFLTAARDLLPRALQHIEALEENLAAAKKGAPQTALPEITAGDIAAIKEIMEEATPGPWRFEEKDGGYAAYGAGDQKLFASFDAGPNAFNDLTFITEARTLVPKAVATIEALEKELAQYAKPATPKAQQGGAKPSFGP